MKRRSFIVRACVAGAALLGLAPRSKAADLEARVIAFQKKQRLEHRRVNHYPIITEDGVTTAYFYDKAGKLFKVEETRPEDVFPEGPSYVPFRGMHHTYTGFTNGVWLYRYRPVGEYES